MILSDREIRELIIDGRLKISPFESRNIQPASVDFHLGNSFSKIRDTHAEIDLRKPTLYKTVTLDKKEEYKLNPKEFVLGTTVEHIQLPNNISAFVEGRSSIGRVGLFIQNAGWVDPGFCGEITLEIFNAGDYPVILRPGDRIGQFIFAKMEHDSDCPYNGKYQHQKGAIGSKIHEDFLGTEVNNTDEAGDVSRIYSQQFISRSNDSVLKSETAKNNLCKIRLGRDIFTNKESKYLIDTYLKGIVNEYLIFVMTDLVAIFRDNMVYLSIYPMIKNPPLFDITSWMKENNKSLRSKRKEF